MFLIDIINALSSPGEDFDAAIRAAEQRNRLLNPIFRRIMTYATEHPEAYECRFSESLLASAAFLLARADDPQFLDLAAPLIDEDAVPSLLGNIPEDTARLLAEVIPQRIDRLSELIAAEGIADHFRADALDALALAVHRNEANREKVVVTLRSFLRSGAVDRLPYGARLALVESCCRIDASEFIIDFQFAIARGALDEREINEEIFQSQQRPCGIVWFPERYVTSPLSVADGYFRRYRLSFLAEELCQDADDTRPDRAALALFNSVAVPSRNYMERVLAICVTPEMVDVCSRVMKYAESYAPYYRSEHHPVAVLTAISLASPSHDVEFSRHFSQFLRVGEKHLDNILGDWLTEICESALAHSARYSPEHIREAIEDGEACGVVRAVALSSLRRQVELGFLSTEQLADYCRELVGRKAEIGEEPWLWSVLVNTSARLGLSELQPLLVAMAREGFFSDESGDEMMSEEEIDSEFASPRVDGDAPNYATTKQILNRGYERLHFRVSEFLGCLKAPGQD